MAVEFAKDTISINALDELNRFCLALNDFLINQEGGDEIKVRGVTVVIEDVDRKGSVWGSFTLYPGEENIKFEPGFVPDLMEVE